MAMNSGPLPLRMCRGTPCVRNKLVRMSSMPLAVSPRSTSKAKHSRVYSSVMANHFSGWPWVVRS